ncbi:MAG: HindVP family restriction endonuclease [Firmicutes bacterium]|nr:HindVP family restriction endonuclease [Bacillota bacterium]
MIDLKAPRLYGIYNSNRGSNDFWGKNEFNSSFPVALACYMRDKKIPAVYLTLNKDLKVTASELSFDDIFNTKQPNNELFFAFESKYEPYQEFSLENIGGIDLVVKNDNGDFLRPIEIKLTVIPDNSTCSEPEKEWGSEIVFRPATTTYCGLGIAASCKNEMRKIRKIFEPVCHKMVNWGNPFEINAKRTILLDAIDEFEYNWHLKQKPLLMQPIWKTQGKSPILAKNAFDIFVWSDFAFTRLFLDSSKVNDNGEVVTRQMRSSARLARFLYEASTSGKPRLAEIYKQMTFDLQTDKEFAVSGKVTRRYMNTPRRVTPAIQSSELNNIILNGGEHKLSPERRFDQTIYFTVAHTHNK